MVQVRPDEQRRHQVRPGRLHGRRHCPPASRTATRQGDRPAGSRIRRPRQALPNLHGHGVGGGGVHHAAQFGPPVPTSEQRSRALPAAAHGRRPVYRRHRNLAPCRGIHGGRGDKCSQYCKMVANTHVKNGQLQCLRDPWHAF